MVIFICNSYLHEGKWNGDHAVGGVRSGAFQIIVGAGAAFADLEVSTSVGNNESMTEGIWRSGDSAKKERELSPISSFNAAIAMSAEKVKTRGVTIK